MCCRIVASCLLVLAMAGVVAAQPPEMPKPSTEHAYLKKLVGNWDCTMKMMGMEMKCSHSYEMLGEFWVMGKFEGDFGGMKFYGRDTCGWDPNKKKYVMTWVDSMSPTLTMLEGTMDASGKTLTTEGMSTNMEGKPCKVKEIVTWKNDDEMAFTMYEEKAGKMEVNFEISYKRRK
ncbi:MAG: DUF1579 family protein [Planctomycetia bacterium]|nr:DUF1579 family protein [Planctomycetia bacterium]